MSYNSTFYATLKDSKCILLCIKLELKQICTTVNKIREYLKIHVCLTFVGYVQPWEDQSYVYPGNFASPLNIAIEASNGASDYGNKFGEPVLAGFSRSYGLTDCTGERREYIKPIMFSGGIGQLEDTHVKKETPVPGINISIYYFTQVQTLFICFTFLHVSEAYFPYYLDFCIKH